MSKDVKPKRQLGNPGFSRRKQLWSWVAALLVCGGIIYGAYNYTAKTVVEVATATARRGDFVIGVYVRGEIESTNSVQLTAPQVPGLQIVSLATSGRPVKKGDVVIEFDAAQQEQYLLERTTGIREADSQIVQTKASHRITDEADGMSLMRAEYNVERAKLEASKAEILSEIEGAKNRINVGINEGQLKQVESTINSHEVTQEADLQRLNRAKEKAEQDLERVQSYLQKLVVRSPIDGIVNILPNFRSGGSFGQMPPPFKEGDSAWSRATIAEIPDLSELRVQLNLAEVDRGRLKLGQDVTVRVDAVPDKEFHAVVDWISPIAALNFQGRRMAVKSFPAQATLTDLDPRLRPGMSATAEIVIERQPGALLIPLRASFVHDGKPAVYVQRGQEFDIREVTVGKRNDNDIVVLSGLAEGEVVALEDPAEAAKRAKSL